MDELKFIKSLECLLLPLEEKMKKSNIHSREVEEFYRIEKFLKEYFKLLSPLNKEVYKKRIKLLKDYIENTYYLTVCLYSDNASKRNVFSIDDLSFEEAHKKAKECLEEFENLEAVYLSAVNGSIKKYPIVEKNVKYCIRAYIEGINEPVYISEYANTASEAAEIAKHLRANTPNLKRVTVNKNFIKK